jgi:hypothetical protein
MKHFTPLKAALTAFFVLAVLISFPVSASALPTASFTFSPTTPTVGQPVEFTFTGSCDLAPCRIRWRWFQTPGSSLGTTIGEGQAVTYTFGAAGTYFVVATITNASPTHGKVEATHGLVVTAPTEPPVAAPVTHAAADFNGDGSTDLALFRGSTGRWLVRGRTPVRWGLRTDVAVPGDYNGDGTTDIAVFRPATGQWLVRGHAAVHWGGRTDTVLPLPYAIRTHARA